MQGKGRARWTTEWSDSAANLPAHVECSSNNSFLGGAIKVEMIRFFWPHLAQLLMKDHLKRNVTLAQKLRHISKELPARGCQL